MFVYISTVVRYAPIDRGGEILLIDWSTKQVEARATVQPSNPTVDSANNRGGARGGRGILVADSNVLVASYHSLEVFDRELSRKIRQVSAPLLVDLHEIAWDGLSGEIWGTSTAIDAAVKIDMEGRIVDSWWPREDPMVAQRFGLVPLKLDKSADHRTRSLARGNSTPGHVHINAVAVFEGRPLFTLNRLGAIVRLNPTEVVIEDKALVGCHNVLVASCGSILVCNTRRRSLDIYDSSGGLQRRIDLTRHPIVQKVLRDAWWCRTRAWLAHHGRPNRFWHQLYGGGRTPRPVFVRGLDMTPDGSVLVGISPAGLLEVDWRTGKILDAAMFSRDVRECVHGIACVPGMRTVSSAQPDRRLSPKSTIST